MERESTDRRHYQQVDEEPNPARTRQNGGLLESLYCCCEGGREAGREGRREGEKRVRGGKCEGELDGAEARLEGREGKGERRVRGREEED